MPIKKLINRIIFGSTVTIFMIAFIFIGAFIIDNMINKGRVSRYHAKYEVFKLSIKASLAANPSSSSFIFPPNQKE